MIDYSRLSINEAFVAEWFDGAIDMAPMTVEEAAEDLTRFQKEGFDIPEDITPEEFAEIWNRFYEAEH